MNGELALSFALVTHGSAWLAERETTDAEQLDVAKLTHRRAVTVSFRGVGSSHSWLEALSAQGMNRLWLAIPDIQAPTDHAWHRRAAFAGSLPAGLLTTGSSGNQLWTASWTVADRGTSAHQAWDVTYRCSTVDFAPQRPRVEEAATDLDAALANAERFAAHLHLDPWPTVFRQARQAPATSGGRCLFPDGRYSDASRQLVAMADTAWVFGGMGSWNDLPYLGAEAHAEYEQISSDLFGVIMSAYVAAANSDPAERS